MADESTTDEQTEEKETKTEETVPYERFQQVTKKAREEAESRKALEKTVRDLKAAMEERENQGLPELERFKADLEKAQKRAEEAEAKAQASEQQLARSARSNLVRKAAANFADPDDAVAFVDLDGIEDERDAERAVKDLAKRKPHLLKQDEPKLPGRVLQNGEKVPPGQVVDPRYAEAEMLANRLAQFVEK